MIYTTTATATAAAKSRHHHHHHHNTLYKWQHIKILRIKYRGCLLTCRYGHQLSRDVPCNTGFHIFSLTFGMGKCLSAQVMNA